MANTDCEKILNLIPLYIDNCLTEEETDDVSRHIASCDACKKEYEFLSSLMNTAASLEETDLSEDFHKRLMEKAIDLKNKKRTKRIILLRRSSAGVAAAAVVALCVASFGNINKTADTNLPDSVIETSPDGETSSSTPTYATDIETEESKTITPAEKPVTKKETPPKTKKEAPAAVPVEEVKDAQNSNKININIPKPSSGGGSSAVVKTAEPPSDISTDATAMAETAETFTVAKISPDEESLDAISQILSAYEKDDTGYIVPDINETLRKISELGIEVNAETSDTYTQNYIILE